MVYSYPACEESIVDIMNYFSRKIKEYQISKKLCTEYELLIEELAIKMIAAAEPNAKISIEVKKRFGAISASLKCAGRALILESESKNDFSGQIIAEYSESLRQSYNFGVNEVVFTTSFSSNEMLLKNIIAICSAITVGLFFLAFFSENQLLWLKENITFPIILIFIRCMQTVAVPVAFFSLVVFVVKIRGSFDRNNKTMRVSLHYFISSIVAIIIGAATWLIFKNAAPDYDLSYLQTSADNFIGNNMQAFLTQVVSTNIIEPFIISNPLPFLVNALITGFAASSVFGKSGEVIKKLMNAINDLFARMMDLIYSLIPFFLFFAIFGLIITANVKMLNIMCFNLLCIFVSLLLLAVYYILRLLTFRVSIIGFFKKYSQLLVDNFKIASNINAFPYNKRVLSRRLSLSRDYLTEALNLGALLNMDGNSIVITVVLLNTISAIGVSLSPMKYVGMAIILLLFSVGAPNQPGSFLLGMIILMTFIGISIELIGVMLIIEALASKLYSSFNSIGDIVTLVIEDERLKRRSAKSANSDNA